MENNYCPVVTARNDYCQHRPTLCTSSIKLSPFRHGLMCI